MAIIIPANSAADTGFSVANSCRFNAEPSYMSKELGTPTSTKICTISVWCKGHTEAGDLAFFSAETDTNERHAIGFENSTGQSGLTFHGKEGGSTNVTLITNATYRDPSAWRHVVLAIDTSQATDTNRIKLLPKREVLSKTQQDQC